MKLEKSTPDNSTCKSQHGYPSDLIHQAMRTYITIRIRPRSYTRPFSFKSHLLPDRIRSGQLRLILIPRLLMLSVQAVHFRKRSVELND